MARLAFALVCLSLLLSGCANMAPTSGPLTQQMQLSGSVHGGKQAVSGATIQLYAAGTTGYGSAATPLLTSGVASDASGNFNITGRYTCPSASSQLYLVATGGNPGLPSGTNPYLALMTALGPCGLFNGNGQYTLDPNSFLAVNEATTVASVFALNAFMGNDASQLGTSSTNSVGLANAFQTVRNLVNITTGAALATTPGGNGIAPQGTVNTLANIMAACVNSNGAGTGCSTLFGATTPSGGPAPTNTIQAILYIARHPGSNTATLFSLVPATASYQPTFSYPPNDWTLHLTYGGFSVSSYLGMAIDAQGNIWFPTNGGNSAVIKLSNTGAVLSGPNGFSAAPINLASSISIDPAGAVWVSGNQPAALIKMDSNGTLLSGSGYGLPAGLVTPAGLTHDGAGNAWLLSSNNTSASLFKFASNGTNLSGDQGFGSGGLASPQQLAVDSTGNIWIDGANSTTIAKFSNSGSLLSGSGFAGGGLTSSAPAPQLAIDNTGSAWVANTNVAQLAKFNSTGTPLSGSGFASCNPAQISPSTCTGALPVAIDGAGNAWTSVIFRTVLFGSTVATTAGIVPLSNTGAPLAGPFGDTTPSSPITMQIDSSGNLWGIGGGVLEVVGVAAPAVTPLSVAARDNKLGALP